MAKTRLNIVIDILKYKRNIYGHKTNKLNRDIILQIACFSTSYYYSMSETNDLAKCWNSDNSFDRLQPFDTSRDTYLNLYHSISTDDTFNNISVNS